MREIIQIWGGQCGTELGTQFLSSISAQHHIDPTGSFTPPQSFEPHLLDTYFSAFSNKYSPRVVVFDLDPSHLSTARSSLYGHLLPQSQFITGSDTAGNNWAKGYYTEGPALLEPLLESIRKTAENCESLQAFQLTHSAGGGTGAGLGSLLLGSLAEDYGSTVSSTFTALPSTYNTECVVLAYNVVLTMKELMEKAGVCWMLDNDAIADCCYKTLHQTRIEYESLNEIAGKAMAEVTSRWRYGGEIRQTVRKTAANLIPFPELHFLSFSFSPLSSHSPPSTAVDLGTSLFSPSHALFTQNITQGHTLAASILSHSPYLADKGALTPYLPDCIREERLQEGLGEREVRASMVGNFTASRANWEREAEVFQAMYRRKAFLHWYFDEGMEEMELLVAFESLQSLIDAYQMCEV
jgi:tubulin beta